MFSRCKILLLLVCFSSVSWSADQTINPLYRDQYNLNNPNFPTVVIHPPDPPTPKLEPIGDESLNGCSFKTPEPVDGESFNHVSIKYLPHDDRTSFRHIEAKACLSLEQDVEEITSIFGISESELLNGGVAKQYSDGNLVITVICSKDNQSKNSYCEVRAKEQRPDTIKDHPRTFAASTSMSILPTNTFIDYYSDLDVELTNDILGIKVKADPNTSKLVLDLYFQM